VKSFAVLVVGLAILSLIGYVYWYNTLPEVEALRETKTAIANRQAQTLAPLWLAVKYALLGALGIGGTLALVGIGYGLARKALLWSHLAYPDRHAMYAEFAPSRLIREITPALNQPKAQVAAALADGNITRWGGAGSVVRALDRPDEPLQLEEPAPVLQLPSRASIYDAPLQSEIGFPVGIDATGSQVFYPLWNLGNLLVGGLPGFGKTEEVTSWLAYLIRQDPEGRRVRIGLADMKEGGADYSMIPGDLAILQWPIAHSVDDTLQMVDNLYSEIKRRNEWFAEAKVPNLRAFEQRTGQHLPLLFMMVDECWRLTLPANRPVYPQEEREASRQFIARAIEIASIGRSAGVTLGLATQKPSSTVIDTTLRDSCALRLAFYCATNKAYEAVLGVAGLEETPSQPGRALVYRGGQPTMIQTYMAGVETGEFETFINKQPLLTVDGMAREVPRTVQAVPGTVSTVPVNGVTNGAEAVYRSEINKTGQSSLSAAKPASSPLATPLSRVPVIPQDRAPETLIQQEYIYSVWLDSATWPDNRLRRPSLNATVRHFYTDTTKGGPPFRWVRAAVVASLKRHKKPIPDWWEKGE
jgi:hypothetical protein